MRTRKWTRCIAGPLCAAIAVLGLAGCSALSTGSSMQVEVEVYKGPLSKEPQAQLGELCGTVHQLTNSLKDYHAALHASVLTLPKDTFNTLDTVAVESQKCDKDHALGQAGAGASATKGAPQRLPMASCWCERAKDKRSMSQNVSCAVLAHLDDEVTALQDEITEFRRAGTDAQKAKWCDGSIPLVTRNNKTGLIEYDEDDRSNEATRKQVAQDVGRLSELSMHLKLAAVSRAEADAIFLPQDRIVRMMSTAFENITAEYSNQIGSRADAWLKQTDVAYPTSLPQSVYLRDSQATEFANLYVWNRAVAPALPQDMVLHPIDSFSSEAAANRVRGVERLFADSYWSKINTVYASGQGDVSMALVKDDIGNWNLKSFSSDPTELLKAYKDGGLALIQTAAELGKTAAGVPNASKVLGFANTLALGNRKGEEGADASRLAQELHTLTQQRLAKLRSSLDNPETDADQVLASAKNLLTDHEANVRALAESSGREDGSGATTPVGTGAAPQRPAAAVPRLQTFNTK